MRRKEVLPIKKPGLKLHIEYDYMTAGELGNILVRLQATTRSIAGIKRGKYKYTEGELEGSPLFTTKSIRTGKSVDITLILLIVSIALATPRGLMQWTQFARICFRNLKTALYGAIESDYPRDREFKSTTGLTVSKTIKRGRTSESGYFQIDKESFANLSNEQKSKVLDLLNAMFGPARRVVLGDEDSEITISRKGEG